MLHYQYIDNDILFTVLYPSEHLYLVGTFTNWEKREDFKFVNINRLNTLQKNRELFNKLGNSGYIEYGFWDEERKCSVPFIRSYPSGYYFNNQYDGNYNYLLLPENITDAELAEIACNNQLSFRVKTKDTEFESRHLLANFREVGGGELATGRLFRSYHPVVASRNAHPQLKNIEIDRQQVAMKLLEEHQIQTVINLSETGMELAQVLDSAEESYYKALWMKGQVVNVPMAYETVYFMSDRDESFNPGEMGFKTGIQTIIKYVAQHQGPYHVHCRLGSDRTGVVIAILQLFLGAGKDQVRHNYLLTNEMAIGEYRSFRLLEQALVRALGKTCFENSSAVVKSYLRGLGLSDDTIERAYENLTC